MVTQRGPKTGFGGPEIGRLLTAADFGTATGTEGFQGTVSEEAGHDR